MDEGKAREYQLVVFTIGNEEFGVEISQVREIVRLIQITYLPRAPVFVEGVVNLRGQILTVIDLAKRLGFSSHPRGEATRIIVVEVSGNTVGMIVDSVPEVLRLSSESIEDVPALVETEVPEHFISGVGKLKDRLLVLLDLDNILATEESQHAELRAKQAYNKDKEK